MNPNIIVTDRDDSVNAKIRVSCTTKEKGSDNEACVTFNVVTEEVRLDYQPVMYFCKNTWLKEVKEKKMVVISRRENFVLLDK